MVGSAGARSPDVVLVVVDCARYSDPGSHRPTSDGLVSAVPCDFVHYPQSVAAATWSVPSHASLFTGLYPWNHRCHNLAGLSLAPGYATVASHLRRAGYATGSFSSNSVLTPESGLLTGFDLAAWGRWSENIFRFSSPSPPHLLRMSPSGPTHDPRPQGAVAAAVASTLRHVPAVGYVVSHVSRRLRRPGSDGVAPVSPWIEPTFDRWLDSVSSDQPIFSVINLMDVHEPYLPDQSSGRRAEILRFSLIPQDGRSYSTSPQDPSPDWVAEVRDLYSGACQVAAQRLGTVWSSLERHGRSRNTLFVVTSDHGQSLGEDGWFFHSHGQPKDELVRVPLAVHYPDSSLAAAARRSAGRWVSLVDLAPTIAEVVGGAAWDQMDGVSLLSSSTDHDGRPALAAGDGPLNRLPRPEKDRPRSRPARTASCVAFIGDTKLAVSGRGGAVDSIEQRSVSGAGLHISGESYWDPRFDTVVRKASEAVLSMLSAVPEKVSTAVDRRLSAWGYG